MKYCIVWTCQKCNSITCTEYSRKQPVLIASKVRWCAVCQESTVNVSKLYEDKE